MDMLGCLVALGFFNPPMRDVQRFPDSWTCTAQRANCCDHLARLRWLRAGCGYDGGQWDRALAETEFLKRYWSAVQVVHDAPGVYWTRRALQDLKDLVGPERYLEGWKPVLMPEQDRFLVPGIADAPVPARGANEGA